MKKLLATMLAISAFQGAAYAQVSVGQQREKTPLQMEEEQKKKSAEKMELEYRATMKRTQGQEAPPAAVDPWANMRGVSGTPPKR